MIVIYAEVGLTPGREGNMELELERDEHGQLSREVIDGLTAMQLSDEVARHEARIAALDVALDTHHARLASNAIPDGDLLTERLWAANAEGSRKFMLIYTDTCRRKMGHKNREAKETRASSHQGTFVSVARRVLSTEQFNDIQDQVARELHERD